MLATIDDFELADGTLSGGEALSQVNIVVQRIFDIVVPLAELDPVLLDRGVRRTTIDFQIARVHESIEAAEIYMVDHDFIVPSSGQVQLIATNGFIRYLLKAALITHERIGIVGKATLHAYHIEGGRILAAPAFYILTEPGDYVLQETGDKIELQN